MTRTILITGFTPFPTAPENPTEVLIEMVRQGEIATPEGVAVSAHVLPVEYEASWARLEELIAQVKPQTLVSFGLSAKATGFTLERLARNEIEATRPDNSGARPVASEILDNGQATLATGLPLDDLFSALSEDGLPVDYSDDAGGYVCNHLFYRCVACEAKERPALAGFVHMPYLEEQRARLEATGAIELGLAALTRDQLKRGVEIILQVVAGKI